MPRRVLITSNLRSFPKELSIMVKVNNVHKYAMDLYHNIIHELYSFMTLHYSLYFFVVFLAFN